MANKFNISHITGDVQVIKNHLLYDEVVPQQKRTISQMFFKPYESSKEFIYCARRTFCPMLVLTALVNSPILTAIALTAALALHTFFSPRSKGIKGILDLILQKAIDILVMPLAALMMITRGIATGIQAFRKSPAPVEAAATPDQFEDLQAFEFEDFQDFQDVQVVQDFQDFEEEPAGPQLASASA